MLITAITMHEYFREALGQAMEKTSHRVTEDAQAYVVSLLSEFSRSEKVYAGLDKGEAPSLALLFARGQNADPEEAARIFRHLGDSSLYFLGFFEGAVQVQSVNSSYYLTMGESAYLSVANLVRDAAASAALYTELADRFQDIVALLNWVSVHSGTSLPPEDMTNLHVLELLERYNRTGSMDLQKVLVQHGVILPRKRSAKLAVH